MVVQTYFILSQACNKKENIDLFHVRIYGIAVERWVDKDLGSTDGDMGEPLNGQIPHLSES